MRMLLNKILFLIFLLLDGNTYGQNHKDLGTLDDYKTSNLIWLGAVVGEVLVDPEIPIKIEKFGKIDWLVKEGVEVMANEVICRTDAMKIQLSERENELKKSNHVNQLIDLNQNHQEKKKTQLKKISELVKTISELRMTPTERSLLGDDFEKRLLKDRVDLEKELKEAQTKLSGDYFGRLYEYEKSKLILELDKSENSHKDLLRSSEFRAETSGSIKILSNEITKLDTYAGMLVKTDTAEASVEMSDSRLTKIPPKELVIRISGDDGLVYIGNYNRTLEDKTYQQRAPIYVFEIIKGPDQSKVPGTLRGRRLIEVCRALEKPGHIVPKADLLFRFPEEINKDGWPAFIQKRWENVNVDYIGPRELVISKKNEN